MRQAQDDCTAVLSLVQTLLNTYASPPALLIVTRDAQAVYDTDRVSGFAQSSLWGLSKVIMLEHPELRCVCMDIGGNCSSQDAADTLFATKTTLSNDRQETQLAWRHGQAYVARLSRYKRQSDLRTTIRSDSTYLITGGRGGVGLQVARWFVEQGAKHLVLLGRSQPSPEVRVVLDELEEAGTEIIAAQADISDEKALAQLLADLTVPLGGVIHAAGVLDDASLLQQTPAKLKRFLSPKVQGAWNLHTLTLDQPLDFFVLFSSVTSVLGTPGQSNYAAANAFLDGLAAYRQGLGLPGLSINWGSWDEVGMAARQGLLEKLPERGEEAIPLQKGLDLFGELLNEPAAQIGVMPIQWPRFLEHQKGDSPFYEKFSKSRRKAQTSYDSTPSNKTTEDIQRKLKQAAPQDRPELLETHLWELVTQLVGMDVAELSSEEHISFMALGLDSLTSIELRNSLQRTLDCSLPVTFVFDYPTIEMAVEYLTQIVLTPMESTASDGDVADLSSNMLTDTPQTRRKSLEPSFLGTSLDNETDVLDDTMQKHVLKDEVDEDESLSALLQKLSTRLD
jgi:acyl carrier protein